MAISQEEWASLREDVGYIKARIEGVPALEERVREVEKRQWMLGGIAAVVAAIAGFFGH